MSPAKQKANEKKGSRDQKLSSRQAPVSGSTGASAYNPESGTFHTLELVSLDSGTGNNNGRFRSIDDVDDNASSTGVGADFESMSNNGSCSGESEDQSHINGKEKHGGGKLGAPPGLVGALDKRDKIRGKNERKHQRQKERRAQELRDKCSGYLMSRKLEALSQQLVAMGFSQERATMALIFNDGHVEQSVAWLLEGGEGQVHEDWNTGGNPKIDISEELGQIAKIEKMHKFARPEIERAVVSCEGDLHKALESLQVRNCNTSPGGAEGHNSHGGSKDAARNSKAESPLSLLVMPHSSGGTQTRVRGILQPMHPSKREDKDLTTIKVKLQGSSKNFQTYSEGSGKVSARARNPPNPSTNLLRSLSPTDQRGYNQGSRPPLCSQTAPFPSVSPPIHGVDFRMGTSFMFANNGTDSKMISTPVRDVTVNSSSKVPAATTQPPKLFCTGSQPTSGINIYPVSSSPMFSPSSWSPGFKDVRSSSALYGNLAAGDVGLKGLSAGNKLAENLTAGVADMQGHYYSLESTQADSLGQHWNSVGSRLSNIGPLVPSSDLMSSAGHSRSSSSTSYGLYSGWGSGLSGSSVDWNAGSMVNCDYKSIDWSMTASPTTEGGCLWGLSSSLTSLKLQEDGRSGRDLEEERRFQAISGTTGLSTDSSNGIPVWKTTTPDLGAQDKTCSEPGNTVALGAHEWTSPFAGKDLFTLPHVVPSPSL